MAGFKIVTDSTADLPKDYIEQNQLGVMVLPYIVEGVSYGIDKEMDVKDFYNKMRGGMMPTTSQVNPESAREYLEGYLEDVEFANNLLHTDLFRPPYGQITPTQARRLSEHYNLIMWDVLSQDYNRRISPRLCLRNVTKHVKGGSIVVFHDSLKSYRNMSYALPRTLEFLQDKGLKCVGIEL